MVKKALIPIILLLLAVLFAAVSAYMMSGYVDCRLDEPFFNHTIPAPPLPDNCASSMRMLMNTLSSYFAIAFILLAVGMPFFIGWKEGESEEYLSIK
jgi:hypothetical protein